MRWNRSCRSVAGQRGPAVVARRMTLQGKVQNALALGVVALVGGGFLAWYYSGLAESRAEAKRTAKPAQVQGEMKLPPLGPAPRKTVTPGADTALVEVGSAEAEALLAAQAVPEPTMGAVGGGAAPGYAVPPPVDPVLQRRLEAPVLVRGVGGYAAAAPEEERGGRPWARRGGAASREWSCSGECCGG